MLINLRNAMMAGKRLPYDAELEYLESTGTQWIDTDVKGDLSNTLIDLRFQIDSLNEQKIFGARKSSTENALAIYYTNTTNRFTVNCGNTYIPYIENLSGQIVVQSRFDGDSIVYSVNGESITKPKVSQITPQNLLLFAYYNGDAVSSHGNIKFYRAKIFIGSILVHDFIPVRKGTVGYLYDRVSGKLFGNAGTGDFVLGPDVVPVEYLECGGSGQYINTGVQPDANTKWTLEAMFPSVSTFMPMGAISTDPTRRFIIAMEGSNKASMSFGSYDNILDIPTQGIRQTYEIDAQNFTWRIGSTSGTFSSGTFDISGIGNLFLFARSRNGSVNSYNANSRVYRSTVYKSNALFQDALPVRVGAGSTWEGAMMDVLTRRIYRNAGYGAFTYGNDLRYPIQSE